MKENAEVVERIEDVLEEIREIRERLEHKFVVAVKHLQVRYNLIPR